MQKILQKQKSYLGFQTRAGIITSMTGYLTSGANRTPDKIWNVNSLLPTTLLLPKVVAAAVVAAGGARLRTILTSSSSTTNTQEDDN